tara:strand:+ start:2765 stop:2929 length:165 start_codon:yes stop_codon:yes gene_type:complete
VNIKQQLQKVVKADSKLENEVINIVRVTKDDIIHQPAGIPLPITGTVKPGRRKQ